MGNFVSRTVYCVRFVYSMVLEKVRTDDYVAEDDMIYFFVIIVAAFSIIAVIVNFVFLIRWMLYPSGCVLSHIIG